MTPNTITPVRARDRSSNNGLPLTASMASLARSLNAALPPFWESGGASLGAVTGASNRRSTGWPLRCHDRRVGAGNVIHVP